MDDVPARDIHDEFDEQPSFPETSDPREVAERFFSKSPIPAAPVEAPVDSTDIFPPLRVVQTEPQAEPVRRILQNTTWVDPVQLRIREAEERRATRKPRQPREPREPRENARRPRAAKQAVLDHHAEPELPFDAPREMPTVIPTPASELPTLHLHRRRHPEPRILYNAWGYRCFLAAARNKPREVAEIILKPGQTWRRRMPIATWR